jgi:hypothetical protein
VRPRKTKDPRVISLLDKIAKESLAYNRAVDRMFRAVNRMRKAQRRIRLWETACKRLTEEPQ